jgi:signal transduction histidine kinase
METGRLFSKIVPALGAAAFLLAGGAFFTAKYADPDVFLPPFFDTREDVNRILFYTNFYVLWLLCGLSLSGCFLSSVKKHSSGIRWINTGFVFRGFLVLVALVSAVVSGYVLGDTLTIKFCIYSAFVLVISSSFLPAWGLGVALFVSVIFSLLSFHPEFLGAALGSLVFSNPDFFEVFSLFLYLSVLSLLIFSIRILTEKYANSETMVSHLNLVSEQMLLFNHRLQEHVKNSGEEAVKKDRLRFTSDLHDSCGYVFTNIIAISNAAMSQENMEGEKAGETFQMILNQAQEGLKRTREILHMIREIREPASKGIDRIYQMKNIFEEVTGINVEIETGNMRHDYGPTVNSVLSRVIQESFTNAVRHGKASSIGIQFWEFPQSLTMTVSDNGMGARQIVKGIGMAGMEERVAAIGGTLRAYSPEDGGFRLNIVIPLVPVKRQDRETEGAGQWIQAD